jgi:hypothetical protein
MYPGSLITNEFYYSYWAYVPSSMGSPNSNQWLATFQIEGTNLPGWYPIGKMQLDWYEPQLHLVWQDLSGHQTRLASAGSLPRDQWVHFEWYTKIGANGELACWMNGNNLWDVTGIDTSGLNMGSYKYFMTCIYGMNGVMYVDDMSLYNVNMNGNAP